MPSRPWPWQPAPWPCARLGLALRDDLPGVERRADPTVGACTCTVGTTQLDVADVGRADLRIALGIERTRKSASGLSVGSKPML